LRGYPVYRQDAEQQRMPHAWHLSREIYICEKAHQARQNPWFWRAFERGGGIDAKVGVPEPPGCLSGGISGEEVMSRDKNLETLTLLCSSPS